MRDELMCMRVCVCVLRVSGCCESRSDGSRKGPNVVLADLYFSISEL